jgi:transcriptional regulator with XRE-family HTH domain
MDSHDKIRIGRQAAKLTVKELAAEIGCAEKTLRNWEDGKLHNVPDEVTMKKICNVLYQYNVIITKNGIEMPCVTTEYFNGGVAQLA